jgi:hypothetical protein
MLKLIKAPRGGYIVAVPVVPFNRLGTATFTFVNRHLLSLNFYLNRAPYYGRLIFVALKIFG